MKESKTKFIFNRKKFAQQVKEIDGMNIFLTAKSSNLTKLDNLNIRKEIFMSKMPLKDHKNLKQNKFLNTNPDHKNPSVEKLNSSKQKSANKFTILRPKSSKPKDPNTFASRKSFLETTNQDSINQNEIQKCLHDSFIKQIKEYSMKVSKGREESEQQQNLSDRKNLSMEKSETIKYPRVEETIEKSVDIGNLNKTNTTTNTIALEIPKFIQNPTSANYFKPEVLNLKYDRIKSNVFAKFSNSAAKLISAKSNQRRNSNAKSPTSTTKTKLRAKLLENPSEFIGRQKSAITSSAVNLGISHNSFFKSVDYNMLAHEFKTFKKHYEIQMKHRDDDEKLQRHKLEKRPEDLLIERRFLNKEFSFKRDDANTVFSDKTKFINKKEANKASFRKHKEINKSSNKQITYKRLDQNNQRQKSMNKTDKIDLSQRSPSLDKVSINLNDNLKSPLSFKLKHMREMERSIEDNNISMSLNEIPRMKKDESQNDLQRNSYKIVKPIKNFDNVHLMNKHNRSKSSLVFVNNLQNNVIDLNIGRKLEDRNIIKSIRQNSRSSERIHGLSSLSSRKESEKNLQHKISNIFHADKTKDKSKKYKIPDIDFMPRTNKYEQFSNTINNSGMKPHKYLYPSKKCMNLLTSNNSFRLVVNKELENVNNILDKNLNKNESKKISGDLSLKMHHLESHRRQLSGVRSAKAE